MQTKRPSSPLPPSPPAEKTTSREDQAEKKSQQSITRASVLRANKSGSCSRT
jgi:hypothetical protein